MDAKITKIIEAAEKRGLGCFGIRQHHEQVSVGDDLPPSRHFVDGYEPEELDGTCCLQINYDGFEVEDIASDIEQLISRKYPGEGPIILVGGRRGEPGYDEGELVIEWAECLYIF